tara:strand:- start:1349 stop:2005 length:657 start_codon:yes stop_codon:yes gene_type:complete
MSVDNITAAQIFASNRNPYNYAKIEQVNRDLSTQWITLEEITQQLNLVDDESQDSYLSSLELATRFAIEDYLGVSMFSTQYRIYYGNPGFFSSSIYLDLPEVSIGSSGVTINEVKCYTGDPTPTAVVISNTNYYYDPTGNRVVLTSVPNSISQIIANPLQVLYTVPSNFISQYPVVKQAGLLMLTSLYNNRSNTTETKLTPIPFGFEQLLRPYKSLVM